MGATVGQLNVLLRAESAQFVSDLGKARAAAKQAGGEIGFSLSGVGEQLKGQEKAVGILTAGLRELGGVGAGEFAKLSVHIGHIAGSANVLGATLAAIGSSALALRSVSDWIESGSKLQSDNMSRILGEENAITKSLTELSRKYGDEIRSRAEGISVERIQTERLIEAQRKSLATAEQTAAALRRDGVTTQPSWMRSVGELFGADMRSPAQTALVKAENAAAGARMLIESISAGLTLSETNEAGKRGEVYRVETETRVAALKEQGAALVEQSKQTEAATRVENDHALQGLKKTLADIGVTRANAVAEAKRQTLAALNSEEAKKLSEAGANTKLADEVRDRYWSMRVAVLGGLSPLIAGINAKFDADAALAVARSGRVIAEGNLQILHAEQDASRAVENLKRNSLDRELADLEAKYVREKAEAERHNLDMKMLAEKHVKEVAAVNAKFTGLAATRQLAQENEHLKLDDPSATFGEGFSARIKTMQEMQSSWGELGAQVADVTMNDFGGLSKELRDIATGQKTAEQAGKEWLRNLCLDLAEAIEKMLIMKAVLALFGGLVGGTTAPSGAAVPVADGGAHAFGGSFRVGGYGGLDSKLVAMRLSPGEVVKIDNGALSGGAGGQPIALSVSVRPPAVIADEVMAKSSPESRALVVATALHRPGRRGARARD